MLLRSLLFRFNIANYSRCSVLSLFPFLKKLSYPYLNTCADPDIILGINVLSLLNKTWPVSYDSGNPVIHYPNQDPLAVKEIIKIIIQC